LTTPLRKRSRAVGQSGPSFRVIFLTDGLPTMATRPRTTFVANAKKNSGGNVASSVSHRPRREHAYARQDHEETRAFSQYVLSEEDIEVKVSISSPKLKTRC